MSIDKHTAVLEYLKTCPEIAKYPLFFNFAEKEDNNQLFATYADSVESIQNYIDGSRDMLYTFTMIVYKSVAYNQYIGKITQGTTIIDYPDENVEEFIDVQSIADWIEEQNDNHIFPDFGTDCVISSIETLTNKPIRDTTSAVEGDMQPALAQYSLGVRISYLDTSKVLWNS